MVVLTPGDAAPSHMVDQESQPVPAASQPLTLPTSARLTALLSPLERSATPPKIPIDCEEDDIMMIPHDVGYLVNTTKIDKKFIFIFKHKTEVR